MKKFALLLSLFVFLIGCKSIDPALMQAGESALNPKLPALEKQIENNYTFIISPNGDFMGANPQDISTLFDKEVTERITNPYTDKKGYIVLKINTYKHKVSPSVALFIPIIGIFTGLPTGVSRSNIEVQIDILNLNRRLLGSYKGLSQTKMKSSLYKNNYTGPVLSRVAYLSTIKEAIQKAKENMKSDVERLVKELN